MLNNRSTSASIEENSQGQSALLVLSLTLVRAPYEKERSVVRRSFVDKFLVTTLKGATDTPGGGLRGSNGPAKRWRLLSCSMYAVTNGACTSAPL